MYFYMTAGLILFRCIEIGFYKTLSSLYQLTNNNNNNNNDNSGEFGAAWSIGTKFT